MANPNKGEVALKVGDQDYVLKLGHNAIAEAEAVLGMGLRAILAAMNDPEKQSIQIVRAMIWAGLRRYHPKVTLLDVGDMFDEIGPAYFGEKLSEALQLIFPPATDQPDPLT